MSVQSQRISGPSGELLEQLLLDDGRSSAESTFPVRRRGPVVGKKYLFVRDALGPARVMCTRATRDS